jgi:hypothetical protein
LDHSVLSVLDKDRQQLQAQERRTEAT